MPNIAIRKLMPVDFHIPAYTSSLLSIWQAALVFPLKFTSFALQIYWELIWYNKKKMWVVQQQAYKCTIAKKPQQDCDI